jgi:hypothetical protein
MLAAWSVSMIGHLSLLTTPVEIRDAQRLSIVPWSSGELRHVRLRPSVVTGRRRTVDAAAGSPSATPTL